MENGEEPKDRVTRHLGFKKPQIGKNTSKRYKWKKCLCCMQAVIDLIRVENNR